MTNSVGTLIACQFSVRQESSPLIPPNEFFAFCICLNEGDEAILLDPPGRGKSPRLRVTFNIDADRWLRITIHDLVRKVDLKVNEPVVRLR